MDHVCHMDYTATSALCESIGGLGSGLGSGIGTLMATSAVSRWGGGAAGRAAEAASRIPSPPPVARDPTRRRITWRTGAEIAAIRFFNKVGLLPGWQKREAPLYLPCTWLHVPVLSCTFSLCDDAAHCHIDPIL